MPPTGPDSLSATGGTPSDDRTHQPRVYPGGLPAGLPLPGQQAGYVLRRTLDHMRELDEEAASLVVAGGDEVSIVCMANVREWLLGLAIRVEAGEPL
jgi:hypothetical protein